MMTSMKHKSFLRLGFICIAIFVAFTTATAQKKHFIYIQAEDKQPFFVMLNNRNYSSTLSGYLVIPKLKNGRYFFTAGFPRDIYPEQKFSCVVEDKDLGYSLKRFGDKGWGLFDYVSFKTIMANPSDWEKDKAVYDTVKLNTDEVFIQEPTKTASPTVSVAASSSSKKVEEPIKRTNETASASQVPIKTETAGSAVQSAIAPATLEASPVQSIQEERKLAVNNNNQPQNQNKQQDGRFHVIKTYDKGTYQGIDQVYIDYTPARADTITIFIPYASSVQANPVPETTSVDTTKPNSVGSSNQYNRSCVNLATEADYGKARRLMSSETTDEKMIASAKRSYKNTCFTTEQIRNLGLLFLSEQSRYKFFVASRPSIYDVFNYPSLEAEFKAPNMIDQFRKSAN